MFFFRIFIFDDAYSSIDVHPFDIIINSLLVYKPSYQHFAFAIGSGILLHPSCLAVDTALDAVLICYHHCNSNDQHNLIEPWHNRLNSSDKSGIYLRDYIIIKSRDRLSRHKYFAVDMALDATLTCYHHVIAILFAFHIF